jgi:site-specific DNA recombinase
MMKRAILYVRVSTDEQAEKGYSLRYQEECLVKYCEINHIEVLAIFKEDHSAKSFDRPQFKKLLEFAKKNSGKVNYMLFINWSRFSRNAGDAYGMINRFNKLGIEPQGIEQPLDLSVPENKMMLAFYLAAPEVENDRRSISTLSGIRRARKEGRWTNLAPKGYKNVRDENNKGLIIPDKNAPLMKEAFLDLSKGIYTQEEIRLKLWDKGLKISKNNFYNLMRNPVYCGKVFIRAFKDEPAEILTGIHEPIISQELFNKVQDLLNGRRKSLAPRHTRKEELPLRGILQCKKCGRNLTGSGSRGNGGKYFYYHCDHGCNERFSATVANGIFIDGIKDISNNAGIVELYYEEVLKGIFRSNAKNKKSTIVNIDEEIARNDGRINNAQEMMLDQKLDPSEYRAMKMRIEEMNSNLRKQRARMDLVDSEYGKYLKVNISMLRGIDVYFEKAPLEVKQKIMGSMFPEKLVFENNQYRTKRVNEVVGLILVKDSKLGSKNKGLTNFFISQSHQGWETGFEPATPRTTI